MNEYEQLVETLRLLSQVLANMLTSPDPRIVREDGKIVGIQ